MTLMHYGQFQSESGILLRETEQADLRITESGDFRETSILIQNAAQSFFVAEGTKLPFTTSMYIKDNGVWKNLIPSVKYLGSWTDVDKIYVKTNNEWKRVY